MQTLIRHSLATLAYRLGKVLRDTPAGFRDFRAGDLSGIQAVRTPGEILAHIGDLMDWALAQVEGRRDWHSSAPLAWDQEIARFFVAIKALDDRIAADGLGAASGERLFQSAIADSLTHTGQIALLRRMAQIPVRGENYVVAQITVGCVGIEQAPPRHEFE
jgi:hypothetical protein